MKILQEKCCDLRSNKPEKIMETYQKIQSHQRLRQRVSPVDESLIDFPKSFNFFQVRKQRAN